MRSGRRWREPNRGTLSLGVPLAAFVYFAIAPALPELPAGDSTVLVAGAAGMVMIAAATLSLVPARDTTIGPLLIVLGAGSVSYTHLTLPTICSV